jgi:hypothetical protein
MKASLFRGSPGSNSPAFQTISLVYAIEAKNASGTIKAEKLAPSIGDLHFFGIYFVSGMGPG